MAEPGPDLLKLINKVGGKHAFKLALAQVVEVNDELGVKIQFPGDVAAMGQFYRQLAHAPAVGDWVVVAPLGNSYVVLGKWATVSPGTETALWDDFVYDDGYDLAYAGYDAKGDVAKYDGWWAPGIWNVSCTTIDDAWIRIRKAVHPALSPQVNVGVDPQVWSQNAFALIGLCNPKTGANPARWRDGPHACFWYDEAVSEWWYCSVGDGAAKDDVQTTLPVNSVRDYAIRVDWDASTVEFLANDVSLATINRRPGGETLGLYVMTGRMDLSGGGAQIRLDYWKIAVPARQYG